MIGFGKRLPAGRSYNIIFFMDERKKLAGNSMEAARIQLAGILCNYLLSEKAAM
jgi:predicted RNA-binding protein with PIN domain